MSNNLVSLHRYYISANLMRTNFDEAIPKGNWLDNLLYMELWYATLYVVVNGWKELKLQDDKINDLLKSPNVKLLYDYRNCVFHFQKDYHDKRVIKFMETKETVEWVRRLNQEFGRYFLQEMTALQTKTKQLDAVSDLTHQI